MEIKAILRSICMVPTWILLLDLHFIWSQHKTVLPSSHSFLISAPYLRRLHQTVPSTACETMWTAASLVNIMNILSFWIVSWQIKVQNGKLLLILIFFFPGARILPSAVGRTCTAEIVLLVTVSAYKWKPSACKVCFSLNKVTLGENVGKNVYMETASGYFRQRRPKTKGTLNRNDLCIARWYKVFQKKKKDTLCTPRCFHCTLNIKYVKS